MRQTFNPPTLSSTGIDTQFLLAPALALASCASALQCCVSGNCDTGGVKGKIYNADAYGAGGTPSGAVNVLSDSMMGALLDPEACCQLIAETVVNVLEGSL